MSNALTKQSSAEQRSKNRGVGNYSPKCFYNQLVFRILQIHYFSSCLFAILLILSDDEVTQEIKCFGTVERFAEKNLFLLVVDTAKTEIEHLFKNDCNLVQVCGLPIFLIYFL